MTVLFVIATMLLFLGIDWFAKKRKAQHAVTSSYIKPVLNSYPVRTPEGIYFTHSHTWLNLFPSGKVRLGIDDFLGRMIEHPQIELLKRDGDHIQKGDPIMLLRDKERTLTVRSPIEADVLTVNEQIQTNPALLKEMLFSDGWAYTLKPKRFIDMKSMLLGPDTKTWMNMEFARFRDFVANVTTGGQLSPVLLQDGGPPVAGAIETVDSTAWQQFEEEFLHVEERSL